MRRHRPIYLETGTRLTFKDQPKKGRAPLLILLIALSTLGLGFAAYLDPTQTIGTADRTPLHTDGATPSPSTTFGQHHILEALAPLPTSPDTQAISSSTIDSEPALSASPADPDQNGLHTQQRAETEATPAASVVQGSSEDVNTIESAFTNQESLGEDVTLRHTAANQMQWNEYEVGPGDTLSRIFSELGIHSQLHAILALGSDVRDLDRIFPGDRLRAGTQDGHLKVLHYESRGDHYLRIARDSLDERFEATVEEYATHTDRRIVHAQIEQSLFLDGARAGIADGTLAQIAEIFGWDIDFAWDIRRGDELIVIYERIYRDGEYLRDGSILAAEFQNRGRTLRALRFSRDGQNVDYYTPEGNSMRQAFIRTPVDVGRISSSFGPRKHPILGYTRQHQGVDYAAPTGTPIRAAGNGRIIHRGTRGGYGNTVMIDHGNNRQTLYAHMSRYAAGQSVGSRVRQGEIIGYVGSTGMSTGPHLHYEFHINGQPVNPVTVELPRADPLPERHKAEFRNATAPLIAALDRARETQLAGNFRNEN